MTWVLVIVASLCALALGALGGHFLALRRMRQDAEQASADATRLISLWRSNETVASAYRRTSETPAPVLAGIERCYYTPPDLERVTWVPRDIPTPFVGYAPAPGPHASAFINSAQFRYDRELEVPKPHGVCRIFLTGASVALGIGASGNATTIGGYLEQHLNAALGDSGRCEVVTVAAGARVSTHERIVIENRLVEFQPDIVISFSGFMDAFFSFRGRNTQWMRSYQDDYFLVLANAALAHHAAPLFPEQDPEGPPVSVAKATERLMRNVVQARHALAADGADYVFALQPATTMSCKVLTAREQVVATYANTHLSQISAFYQGFRESLQALDQPSFSFVDVTKVFDGCGDDVDIFIDVCHVVDRGNDLIARLLSSHILPGVRQRLGTAGQAEPDA